MDAIADVLGGLFEAAVNVLTFIVQAVGVSAFLIVCAAATALVGRDYWNWFVAPLGMPHVGLPQALGLTLFVGFLRTDYSKRPDAAADEAGDSGTIVSTIGAFAGLGLTWAIGWLLVTLAGPF